jgi:DNA-binding LytR/AlgR family response regulator
MLTCIIIEDEKNAQQVLIHYLSKKATITCLGIYETGLDIPSDILSKVDFIFLDIELPVFNGLEFLKTLKNSPKVIVTTAYPHFAVDAFELAVIDYLVKPFSYDRFIIAVDRIITNRETNHKEYILVYADKTTHKIKTNDILYIKSELDYISIVTMTDKILLLGSLTIWAIKMSKFSFARAHRSYIVNTNRIKRIKSNRIEIENVEIPLGSVYKKSFIDKFTRIRK